MLTLNKKVRKLGFPNIHLGIASYASHRGRSFFFENLLGYIFANRAVVVFDSHDIFGIFSIFSISPSISEQL